MVDALLKKRRQNEMNAGKKHCEHCDRFFKNLHDHEGESACYKCVQIMKGVELNMFCYNHIKTLTAENKDLAHWREEAKSREVDVENLKAENIQLKSLMDGDHSPEDHETIKTLRAENERLTEEGLIQDDIAHNLRLVQGVVLTRINRAKEALESCGVWRKDIIKILDGSEVK